MQKFVKSGDHHERWTIQYKMLIVCLSQGEQNNTGWSRNFSKLFHALPLLYDSSAKFQKSCRDETIVTNATDILSPNALKVILLLFPQTGSNFARLSIYTRGAHPCFSATNSIPLPAPRLREYFLSWGLFQCSWTPRLGSRFSGLA